MRVAAGGETSDHRSRHPGGPPPERRDFIMRTLFEHVRIFVVVFTLSAAVTFIVGAALVGGLK